MDVTPLHAIVTTLNEQLSWRADHEVVSVKAGHLARLIAALQAEQQRGDIELRRAKLLSQLIEATGCPPNAPACP